MAQGETYEGDAVYEYCTMGCWRRYEMKERMVKVKRKSSGVHTVETRVKIDGSAQAVTFFLMRIKDLPGGRNWVLSLRDGARLRYASYFPSKREALDQLPKAFATKADGTFAIDTAH